MKSNRDYGKAKGGLLTAFFLVGVLTGIWSERSSGDPPRVPLPPPFYSFDLASPSVADGTVSADGVLELQAANTPGVAVPGGALGLGMPGDDLDALSTPGAPPSPTDTFVLLFSVDRATVGVADPDVQFIDLNVPYNVKHQALRGQAAGDQYMSATLFNLATGAIPQRAAIPNSVLIRNNYDEGGTDFGGEPPADAGSDESGKPQDDTDATGESPPAASTRQGVPQRIYFSATADSPSLLNIGTPGGVDPSGANIFFVMPDGPRAQATVFASASELGLMVNDDVDAMAVFDFDGSGTFSPGDIVLFSLAPGSPSLGQIPGASQDGAAADVFKVQQGMPPSPSVFANASELGLGAASDNVDSLAFLPCNDAVACAADHGIQGPTIPAVSEWGIGAAVLVILAAGTLLIRRRRRLQAPASRG